MVDLGPRCTRCGQYHGPLDVFGLCAECVQRIENAANAPRKGFWKPKRKGRKK